MAQCGQVVDLAPDFLLAGLLGGARDQPAPERIGSDADHAKRGARLD